MAVPTIVAMGGGTLDQPYDPTREHFIFSLARRTRPRVAFLGTASGDSEAYTANFFRSVGGLECDATDLPLFQRREADLRRIVLALDVIYVGATQVLDDGLGFLSGSACPHYDEDPTRRPAYRTAVARGEVSPGYAADGAAALIFRGSRLEEVVSWSENATGYRVEPGQNGEATEQALPARRLAPAQVGSPSRVT